MITGYFFGVIGIAISTLVVYVFAFLLTSHYAFKFIRCNFYYGFILKAVSSSIVITLLLLIIKPHGSVEIIFSILLAFAIYMILMILFKGIKPYEINFFLDIIKESISKRITHSK